MSLAFRNLGVAAKVLAAFDANPKMTSGELAELTGIRAEYVRTALKRNGRVLARGWAHLPPKGPRGPRRKYRKLQEWETQAVLDAFRGGEKLEAIAEEFDINQSTASLIAKKHGLSRKRTPEQRLIKYLCIGFDVELLSMARSFASKNRIGFGEAVRRLLAKSLKRH